MYHFLIRFYNLFKMILFLANAVAIRSDLRL